MASSFPSTHTFSASAHLQPSTIALKLNAPALSSGLKGCSWCNKTHKCMLSFKANGLHRETGSRISCAMNMTAGQSDESGRRFSAEDIIDKARKLWESSPQPVKSFPWSRALDNFIQITLDLVVAVIKYLYVPVMAVVSLSEMSYCGHERKLLLIPIPLLLGVAVAGYLAKKALEISPFLKEDAEVPWHLIAMTIFFTLIKLPGPYYRYWGRILVPHFANGGILRTLWLAYLWYRRPRKQ